MRDVSVCITCYNEAEYIGSAIRSALEQTAIDRIKEIIVVDDGSTDESERQIRELAAEDTRLIHVTQQNQGLPAARNAAMRRATGRYIAFLDGDDFWEPRKASLQQAAFEDPGIGLVYSDYVDFQTDRAADRMLICVRRFSRKGCDLVREFFVHDGPIMPSSVMIRREVFQEIGGFDVRYRIGEDTDYWIRVALGGFGFQHTPGGLVFKRRHDRNLTKDLERFASVFEEQTYRYADQHEFLKPLAAQRLSMRYAKIGQSLLASGRFGRASCYLTRALQYDLRNARAYAYVGALPLYALGGPNALNGMKRVYHFIRSKVEFPMRAGTRIVSKPVNDNALHIAMVLPTYFPESFGGAEQQCRKLSRALCGMGAQVTILAPRLLRETPRRERDSAVTIRRFRVRKAPNLGGRYIGSLLVWSAAVISWLWIHRHAVDVIHIFHGRLHALPGVLGGTLTGKPTLVKIGRGGEHFDLSLVRGKRLGGPLAYRTLLKHTSGYIANSREIVDDLLAHDVPPERILAVPNGVEIPDTGSGDVSGPTDGSGPGRYVYLGRLDPEKRIDLMLKGFARFSDSSARLTIVGEGECRTELERLASELGLQARVAFPGRTDDVSKYLRFAHFYVSTSASEGMSNALLEAMSFGVVPLVSEVSGAKDILDHGRSGFLFEPDNLDDFVAKLELMRSTTATTYRAMSDAARESIRQRFGIERIADQHLHIYRTVLDRSTFPRFLPESRSEAAVSSRPLAHSE